MIILSISYFQIFLFFFSLIQIGLKYLKSITWLKNKTKSLFPETFFIRFFVKKKTFLSGNPVCKA